jgi:hypothetical protein
MNATRHERSGPSSCEHGLYTIRSHEDPSIRERIEVSETEWAI